MPTMPVDECPAGPAMDAAVAEALAIQGGRCEPLLNVFSLTKNGWELQTRCRWCWKEMENGVSDFCPKYPFPPYSTDIAAAWELVEWCRTNLNSLATFIEWKKGWDINFSNGSRAYGSFAKTCPLAICRAFLEANGVEHVEVPG